MSIGTIYILSNDAMHNMVKIGHTVRNVRDRAKELSSVTSVPISFKIVYNCDVFDSALAESIIHNSLRKYRVNVDREFFCLDPKSAIDMVSRIIEENGLLLERHDDKINFSLN